eukprot:10644717-Alexandrium_andersonii.AAC.1
MVLSPFRPCGVVARWPYLGISAGCLIIEAGPPPAGGVLPSIAGWWQPLGARQQRSGRPGVRRSPP